MGVKASGMTTAAVLATSLVVLFAAVCVHAGDMDVMSSIADEGEFSSMSEFPSEEEMDLALRRANADVPYTIDGFDSSIFQEYITQDIKWKVDPSMCKECVEKSIKRAAEYIYGQITKDCKEALDKKDPDPRAVKFWYVYVCYMSYCVAPPAVLLVHSENTPSRDCAIQNDTRRKSVTDRVFARVDALCVCVYMSSKFAKENPKAAVIAVTIKMHINLIVRSLRICHFYSLCYAPPPKEDEHHEKMRRKREEDEETLLLMGAQKVTELMELPEKEFRASKKDGDCTICVKSAVHDIEQGYEKAAHAVCQYAHNIPNDEIKQYCQLVATKPKKAFAILLKALNLTMEKIKDAATQACEQQGICSPRPSNAVDNKVIKLAATR